MNAIDSTRALDQPDELNLDCRPETAALSRDRQFRSGELDRMQSALQIRGWSPRPTFLLGPGRVRYRADALVLGPDGSAWVEDVGGCVLARWRSVKGLWRAHGPCDLRLMERNGAGWLVYVVSGKGR